MSTISQKESGTATISTFSFPIAIHQCLAMVIYVTVTGLQRQIRIFRQMRGSFLKCQIPLLACLYVELLKKII